MNDDDLATEAATSRVALALLIVRGDRKIASCARRCSGSFWFGPDRPDIHQQGRIGVCYAVRLYAPSSGHFWTYAAHWIRHEVTRWLAYCGTSIRYPAAEFTLAVPRLSPISDDDSLAYDGTSAIEDLIDVPAATRTAYAAMNSDGYKFATTEDPRRVRARKLTDSVQLTLGGFDGSHDCKE